jgi:hypothetical protein
MRSSHPRRIALALILVTMLGGCPTPIPGCDDTRTYLPSILVAESRQAAEAVVIGRLIFSNSSADPVLLELSRLDDDTIVARTSLPLASDGWFMWGLDRGTYVISRVDRFSDYAKGEYQVKASFYPHLRFEATGIRYVGQVLVVLDPDLNDILPAALFAPGTPRQGKLGVRSTIVSDELQNERDDLLAPDALRNPALDVALMHAKPVEVYRVRTKQSCSRWKYWRLCLSPFACS